MYKIVIRISKRVSKYNSRVSTLANVCIRHRRQVDCLYIVYIPPT